MAAAAAANISKKRKVRLLSNETDGYAGWIEWMTGWMDGSTYGS